MLNIKVFTFNPFAENTFIVWDETTKESMIVDPGCFYDDEKNEIKQFISSNNIFVKYLVNTHCHIDHIFGCDFVKSEYNPVYYAPELDLPLLQNAEQQAKMFGIKLSNVPQPDKKIEDNLELKLSESKVQFLFTPGHTPGEFSIYFPDDKFCITGDVLFKEGIGRTDLWGGDYKILINSIKNTLFQLPDETIIYPGHGEKSTIEYEKNVNPFLRDLR